ncbi:MAG: hypothetical protein WCA81_06730 [Rhizomicrobium sp.]
MSLLRGLVRYGAMPVFWLMAGFQYAAAEANSAAMGGMDMAPKLVLNGFTVPGALTGALTSMWLMYVLMGVFHTGSWLDLLARKRPHMEPF